MRLIFLLDKEYEKIFIQDSDLRRYVDEQHRIALLYLEATKNLYQASWDLISSQFAEYIETRTSAPWRYDQYECVVSVLHEGLSNWGTSNRIVRGWKENPYSMRRITAHELVISHLFEIYKNRDHKLSEKKIWAIAEISAFALTSMDTAVEKFWPWNTEYYTDHNYPELVDLQLKLGPIFKKKSFDKYLDEAEQTIISMIF